MPNYAASSIDGYSIFIVVIVIFLADFQSKGVQTVLNTWWPQTTLSILYVLILAPVIILSAAPSNSYL